MVWCVLQESCLTKAFSSELGDCNFIGDVAVDRYKILLEIS